MRRRFGEPRRRRQVEIPTTETGLATARAFEVGQKVWSRSHDPADCKNTAQHGEYLCGGYWYDPWYIEKIGPVRLLVSNRWPTYEGYVEGHVSRHFIGDNGWGIAYGPFNKGVAVLVLERPAEYVRETLGYMLFREGQLRTLGLRPEDDGNLERIKEAHRILARKHHPDTGGDAEEFKRVQAAYEDLTNMPLGEQLKRLFRFMRDEGEKRL